MSLLNIKYLSFFIVFFILSGCKKGFLDKKPNTNIVIPSTLDDMTQLLDNKIVTTAVTPGLGILSADEYYYPTIVEYNNTFTKTEKNAYIWTANIFDGETKIEDWNAPYRAIFTANVVLEQWNKLPSSDQNSPRGAYTKAWALFCRSYSLFNLVQIFSPIYNKSTAVSDLGIPLKLSANINDIQQRSTLKRTYDQILSDLETSLDLYSNSFPEKNRNRPSKVAVYALLSRIYLYMQEYSKSLSNAENALLCYNKLIDYNTLDQSLEMPFSIFNDEVLYQNIATNNYFGITVGPYYPTAVNPELVNLYSDNDLRKSIFFRIEDSRYLTKFGYAGDSALPFTGLATDEVYLIKSESQARTNDLAGSLTTLNFLLENRYKKGTYVSFQSSSRQDVLNAIANERRKELVWRGQRWQDIKRLNREGANITLKRVLGGTTYSLPPNDPRYVMPIPDDEIALSHIKQNNR